MPSAHVFVQQTATATTGPTSLIVKAYFMQALIYSPCTPHVCRPGKPCANHVHCATGTVMVFGNSRSANCSEHDCLKVRNATESVQNLFRPQANRRTTHTHTKKHALNIPHFTDADGRVGARSFPTSGKTWVACVCMCLCLRLSLSVRNLIPSSRSSGICMYKHAFCTYLQHTAPAKMIMCAVLSWFIISPASNNGHSALGGSNNIPQFGRVQKKVQARFPAFWDGTMSGGYRSEWVWSGILLGGTAATRRCQVETRVLQ